MRRQQQKFSFLAATFLFEFFLLSTAFLTPQCTQLVAANDPKNSIKEAHFRELFSSSSSSSSSSPNISYDDENTDKSLDKNSRYIKGLMDNLSTLLDKYIMSGSPKIRERVFNVLDQISSEAKDEELVHQSLRMVKRAGVPMNKTYLEKYANELGKTDSEQRRQEALQRKQWEEQRGSTEATGSNVADKVSEGRSALSRRETASTANSKPDLFMNSVLNPDSIATISREKSELQQEMEQQSSDGRPTSNLSTKSMQASNRVSELIAAAGAGSSFNGEVLGIGGLDDVLAQVKRRVWTPLAAPPQLLRELGIHPVRGLLLYGKPGCGKTLLARTLGNILSPMRPITVVSGPEIMDKFVGSSEKNLRDIFDSPPDIYDRFRIGEKDGGESLASAALHVIVMDEFDAVARTRGGRGGKGDQGDAGVARDSVVNQLLAKMDGVQPLPVPTLVIGLTNKRSLIEPALLRPGRFEVQVEVPPPRSINQRVSILRVHSHSMHEAGRLLVADPPIGTAAHRYIEMHASSGLTTYSNLLEEIAGMCEGFSGAALAGVARAAASHALQRAVDEFSERVSNSGQSTSSLMDCLVTRDDFHAAVEDVMNSMGSSDYSDDDAMPLSDEAGAQAKQSPSDSFSPE